MVPYKDLNLTKSKLYSYVQKSADFVNGQADPTALLGQMLNELLFPTDTIVAGNRDAAIKSANEYCTKYGVYNTEFYIAYRNDFAEDDYKLELFVKNN